MDLEVDLDLGSATPPYEQVRSQLAAQIGDRTLPVGTRLPPVRTLAGDLGLAANTVARVYRELESAGLVETRGRAGTVVCGTDRALVAVRAAAQGFAATAHAAGLDRPAAEAIARAAFDAQGLSR